VDVPKTLDIGSFRCIQAHCEMCTVEMRLLNGLDVSDPRSEIQVIASLKVRDFTVPSWSEKGKGAKRHNIKCVVDLENAQLLWHSKPLDLSNLEEILAGIGELLGGVKRENKPLKVKDTDTSF